MNSRAGRICRGALPRANRATRARTSQWQDIADAVADVYTRLSSDEANHSWREHARVSWPSVVFRFMPANRPLPSRSGVGFVDRIARQSGSSFVLDCANDRREYGAASPSGDYL